MEALAELFLHTPFAAIGTLAAVTIVTLAVYLKRHPRKVAPVAVIKHQCHTKLRSRYD